MTTTDDSSKHNTPSPAASPDAAGQTEPAADAATARRKRKGTSGSARRQRDDRVTFRLLPEEAEAVARLAAAAGLPVAAYCRTVALTGKAPQAPRTLPVDRAELVRVLGQLGRVGNNLNQVARSLNIGRPVVDSQVHATMQAVQAAVAEVMTALGRRPIQ